MSHHMDPWHGSNWDIVDKKKRIVAKVLPWDASGCRDEDHHNVNLIAAAPELLEALEMMIAEAEREDCQTVFRNGVIGIALDAVNKARGM